MSFFKLNFSLTKQHGYSYTELENMIPWEREILVAMLNNYLKEKEVASNQG